MRNLQRTVTGLWVMLLVCLAVRSTLAQAQKKLAGNGRETLTLDGDKWRFLMDSDGKGEANGWTKTIPATAQTATLPGPVLPKSEQAAWFWREFQLPPAMQKADRAIRLQFGAAAENTDVWLNGKLLGVHVGGAVPFEFNITTFLEKSGTNLLVVRGMGGGLPRHVRLVSHDEAYIADVFPQAGWAGGLNVPITLVNTSVKTGDGALQAEVFPFGQPKNALRKSWQYLHVSPGRNVTTLLVNLPKKAIKPWTPDKPALYTLWLWFEQGEDLLDKVGTTFGFREWDYRDKAITLNETPVTLKSGPNPFGTEGSAPATDSEREHAISVMRGLRSGGTNLIYLEAPDPALLDCADAAGMLVVVGPRSGQPSPVAFEELRALMVRDRAHPSIIAWNLGDRDKPGILLCAELDPTRFLLVGTGAKTRLWLPHQDTSADVAPPPGFLLP